MPGGEKAANTASLGGDTLQAWAADTANRPAELSGMARGLSGWEKGSTSRGTLQGRNQSLSGVCTLCLGTF